MLKKQTVIYYSIFQYHCNIKKTVANSMFPYDDQCLIYKNNILVIEYSASKVL